MTAAGAQVVPSPESCKLRDSARRHLAGIRTALEEDAF